ncbi:MAG: hypothetical protein GOVbin630_194 [Prokaryotic dsDNA virus sp.]|mgnify:CR=1 FL=1|nr:MAG: hypothetical protein GOVbin630_194 [Prokaryotic dsDNA virus sp.]|tara:strand:+ start:5403 stop:5714 length:312 start_codon:yes stop_codon:yes gene_type:complete
MRVNLSYSVELDDVLAELSELFAREKGKFEAVDKTAMRVLQGSYTDENLRDVFNTIDIYKEALANLEIKLDEIQQIIKGYHDIINAPLETSNPQPDGGEDDEL